MSIIVILNPWCLTSCIAPFPLSGGKGSACSSGCGCGYSATGFGWLTGPDQTRSKQSKQKRSRCIVIFIPFDVDEA